MPYFPEPIQDIIRGMLHLDPTQRITIPQIKDHPAFRYGLPDQYVLPRPLPLDCGEEGIDPSIISPEITDILHKIGFTNDEELQADFTSNERSMAKVFYMMLTSRVALDQLQWEFSVDEGMVEEPANYQDAAIIISPTARAYTLANQSDDPFHRHVGQSSIAEMGTSYAAQAEWNVPNDEGQAGVIQVHSVLCQGYQVSHAVCLAQNMVRQFQMQWFHPDEFTIIARHEPTGNYLVITARPSNQADAEGSVLEFQLCHGQVDQFMIFCQAVEEAIGGGFAPQ